MRMLFSRRGDLGVVLRDCLPSDKTLASATAMVRSLVLILRFSFLQAKCLLGLMPKKTCRLAKPDTHTSSGRTAINTDAVR